MKRREHQTTHTSSSNMHQTALLGLIASGRSSRVEFVRDDIAPEQLARILVSMANLHGGHVLLGVNTDGGICGVHRPALEDWVMNNVCRPYVQPNLSFLYEDVLLPDGKRVVILTVAGTAQPYLVRHATCQAIHPRTSNTSRTTSLEQRSTSADHAGRDKVAAV
jgi:predicted HTH transcriptional regulator